MTERFDYKSWVHQVHMSDIEDAAKHTLKRIIGAKKGGAPKSEAEAWEDLNILIGYMAEYKGELYWLD